MSNDEWVQSVEDLKNTAKERNSRLRKALVAARGEWNLFKAPKLENNDRILSIVVNSRSGISLESVDIKVPNGVNSVTFKPTNGDKGRESKVSNGKVSFKQLYRLFSHRERTEEKNFKIVPGTYLFKVSFNGNLSEEPVIEKIAGKNSVTGGDAELRHNPKMTPVQSTGYLQTAS